MLKKQDLVFNPVTANGPPAMGCHYCGQTKIPQFLADLYPFEDESASMSLVACSVECRDNMLSFPDLEKVLNNMALDIAISAGLELKE